MGKPIRGTASEQRMMALRDSRRLAGGASVKLLGTSEPEDSAYVILGMIQRKKAKTPRVKKRQVPA